MLNPWIAEILAQDVDVTAAIRIAQAMAHQAFTQSDRLKISIDRSFGGQEFRTNLLESLLRKERELDALRQRVSVGGGRSDDPQSLNELIQRRTGEYTRLAKEIASYSLSDGQRRDIEKYLEARRQQLYLGDADRVRRAITNHYLSNCSRLAS